MKYSSAQVRHRLGQVDEKSDGIWFDYENGNLDEIVKNIIFLLEKEAAIFFEI